MGAVAEEFADFERWRQQSPFDVFAHWLAEAQQKETVNYNAMSLATVTAQGVVQARTVLLKQWSPAGFIFYTNKGSRKGRAMAEHPQVAGLFYWKSCDRQVLIQGSITLLTAQETQDYFQSRPFESQLHASVSQQSRAIESLQVLRDAVEAKRAECADATVLPLPPDWQGYRITPNYIEFWQEGEFRLHKRLAFTHENGEWQSQFLQP